MAARTIRTGAGTYRTSDGQWTHGILGDEVDVHSDDVERFDRLNGPEPKIEETHDATAAEVEELLAARAVIEEEAAKVSEAKTALEAERAEFESAKAELAEEREAFAAEKEAQAAATAASKAPATKAAATPKA